MKRDSVIRRLLGKLRGAKPAQAAAVPPATAAPAASEKPPRRKTDSSFEPLEGRIAPAVLLNASTVQFTDVDGDLVTIQFSKALFKEGALGLDATLDSVFKFLDGGTVRTAADGGSKTDVHQLATLDLAVLASVGVSNPANGTNISITAVKQAGVGDDHVNVGYIKAAHSSLFGIALGKVVVDGDLGRIDAGDRTKTIGIKSITVDSWGKLGTTTQLSGGNLESNVTSGIGTMTVLGDFKDAVLRVVQGDSDTRHAGKIGKLTIGGDLFATTGNNLANAGAIAAAGNIGSIKVGNIFGGGGQNSGKITASGKIGSVMLEGDLRGGAGKDSGQIEGLDGIGKISLGTLWAGSGEGSGRIVTQGSITSVTFDELAAYQSFSGINAGKNSGTISAGEKIGSVTVAGNVSGGAGETSGRITAGTVLGKVTIGGHLIGGTGSSSGQILAGGSIGSITINGATTKSYISIEETAGAEGVQEKHILKLGDVLGRPSDFTLSFGVPGSAAETTVTLSSASTAEQIQAALNALPAIGPDGVTVGLQGSTIEITFAADGQQAGLFSAAVTQASIVGGTGAASGSVISTGSIGKVTVQNLSGGAALKAGNGAQSGSISASGNVGRILVHGDLDGIGAATLAGGGGISVGGNLGSLIVNGDLAGGHGDMTASVTAEGNIGTIKITGSLLGGAGDTSGSIIAGGKIASALVTGSLIGGAGENSAALVAGMDITGPSDFGKVTVLGQLVGDGAYSASIRAGGKLGKVVVGALSSTVPILSGGDGAYSASLIGGTGITSVTVNGDVTGGGGVNSATIESSVKIASVKIAGNLSGGLGDGSGSIAATEVDTGLTIIPGDIAKVSISGALNGGGGTGSGQIRADGSIKSVKVGAVHGDEGDWSGSIVAGRGVAAFLDEFKTIGTIGSLVVNGPISGGIGVASGNVEAGAKIASLVVNGGVSDTVLRTGRDFGSITINGNASDVLISAEGSAKATERADVAIAKLTVNGNVENTVVRAGYDLFGNAVNGNAQIGAVKVTGTWTASSIAAGVVDVDGDGFGDDDDTVIAGGTISKIASIVIGQTITGTADDGDHFGFTAQTIGSVKIAGITQPLTIAKNTIPLAGTPDTDDTSIREVP